MDSEQLKASPASVPSLMVAQVLPGDLVWLPMGFYAVERAINEDSITLHAAWWDCVMLDLLGACAMTLHRASVCF